MSQAARSATWIAVHREDDNELVGHVAPAAEEGGWSALTIFGAELRRHDTREAAEADLVARGLACLAERWWYRPHGTEPWLRARLIEVRRDSVVARVRRTGEEGRVITIAGAELDHLQLARPD